jgi:hypothetical protein
MPFIPIPLDWVNEHLELAPELGSGLRWKKAPASNKKYMLGQMAGSLGQKGYWKIRMQGRDYRCHRVVWALAHQADPDLTIDHINRDKSSNSIINLRLADAFVQGQNQKWRGGTSKYPGVCLIRSGRWMAQYHVPGSGKGSKKKYLGTFKTETEAWKAILRDLH